MPDHIAENMYPNAKLPIEGVWTALATPFKADGSIDWSSFDKLLELQITGGIDGIVLSGTTGESATLTVPEKLALIRKARVKIPSSMRIMAGCGDSSTQQCVELSKLSEDAGADSLLIVTPPYNKPSTSGLVLHYKSVSQAVKIPICLYHVPSRTAHFLTVDALKQVCAEAHVAAIKEASSDLGFFSRVVNQIPCQILSGDDSTFLASLAVGGHGVISVITNLFPAAFVAIKNAMGAGNLLQAQKIHQALLPAIDVMFCEVNPCPLKVGLKAFNLAEPYLRAPLAPISAENHQKVVAVLTSVRKDLEIKLNSRVSA